MAKALRLPIEFLPAMNLRNFIGICSILLLAWLGATYFHRIPPERYQIQTRTPASAVVEVAPKEMIVKFNNEINPSN